VYLSRDVIWVSLKMREYVAVSSTASEKSMNTSAPQKTPHRRSKRSIRINSKATATPRNDVGWFKV